MPSDAGHPYFSESARYEEPELGRFVSEGDDAVVRGVFRRALLVGVGVSVGVAGCVVVVIAMGLLIFGGASVSRAVELGLKGGVPVGGVMGVVVFVRGLPVLRARGLRRELALRGVTFCPRMSCRNDCTDAAGDRCPICEARLRDHDPYSARFRCQNPACRYDCRGIAGRTCPECGSEVLSLPRGRIRR